MATVNPEETAQRIEESVPQAENTIVPQAENTAESEPAQAPAPSRRDKFREGIKGRNAELDMENEDAYYDYLDGQLAERDEYEGALDNMRKSIDESPEFAEMLVEASKQKNYSPIHFLLKKVAEGEVDLDALQNDPEYVDAFAEAQQKALASKEEAKKNADIAAKNFEASIELMNRIRDERGLTQEQVNDAMAKVYAIFDDLRMNKVSEETFNAILDAGNYKADVENAREEGRAQGMQTKVTDKLRKMSKAHDRVGGGQAPMPESQPQGKPEREKPNMFGL